LYNAKSRGILRLPAGRQGLLPQDDKNGGCHSERQRRIPSTAVIADYC